MTRPAFLHLIGSFCLILYSCAANGPKVLDVTELAPPVRVQLDTDTDEYIIRWQPSYHQNDTDFTGYNIYISVKSLILAPVADLPVAVELGPDALSYVLEGGRDDNKLFVHVRSRNSKGHVSLPSLPEVIVQR